MTGPRFDRDTARRMMEEGMRRAAEKATIDMRIKEQRAAYEAAGFTVCKAGEMKAQSYIDVKAKEAKVDDDFYDHS